MATTDKMMHKKSILNLSEQELAGKKVLVRVDFNVPIVEGKITDDRRIKAALPTIEFLVQKQARVILMSHLGRPKGVVKEDLRLNLVSERLAELLSTAQTQRVTKLDDCIGAEILAAVSNMKNGDIILLENIRFYKEETSNDENFAKKLAELGDLFVNDAFGTAHRAHASTAGIAQFLPAYAGVLVQKELKMLGSIFATPQKPVVAIIGGAKVGSKIGILKNLLAKVGSDGSIIIGGGMAYTFLHAQGYEIGKSLLDVENLEVAKEFMAKAKSMGIKVLFPQDVVIADDFAANANTEVVTIDAIKKDWQALDIGPKTIAAFNQQVNAAGTVIWNGPMGVFEMETFAKGTFAVAQALAQNKGVSIICGGDSAASVHQAGLSSKMTHVSTGGGATLELLEGKELPGIAVLQD
ncbi:MAG: Phosphoglycerate kinase [Candidatus Magnetoglobus multicellularis str. Araruama]|uniref:Phosphoglycerate kinase n=1 Tax=Candidatus Magnetoglobus multicellularis str. Araruama TaxID=890399 RepID=A0A1V1P0F6_9BACT|nr:MAG: Phosphoglycerate kinase [Candidatus Magnetoglobus multicellularis str. Araruama]